MILTPLIVTVGSINPSENGAMAEKSGLRSSSALLSVGKGEERGNEGGKEGKERVISWNAELPSLSCNSDLEQSNRRFS